TTNFGRSRSWRSARGAPSDQALTDVGVPGVDRHARISIRALRSHAHVSAVAKTPASLRVFAVIGAAALLGLLLMPFGLGAQAAAKPPLIAAIQPHIFMVLMENTSYEHIVGNASIPFVNVQMASNVFVSNTDLNNRILPHY